MKRKGAGTSDAAPASGEKRKRGISKNKSSYVQEPIRSAGVADLRASTPSGSDGIEISMSVSGATEVHKEEGRTTADTAVSPATQPPKRSNERFTGDGKSTRHRSAREQSAEAIPTATMQPKRKKSGRKEREPAEADDAMVSVPWPPAPKEPAGALPGQQTRRSGKHRRDPLCSDDSPAAPARADPREPAHPSVPMITPPRRHSKGGRKQREDAAEALEAAEAPQTPPTATPPAASPVEPEGALSDVVNPSTLKRKKGGRKQREGDQPQGNALAEPSHGGRGSPDARSGEDRPRSSSAAAGAQAATDLWTHREAAVLKWGAPGESPSEGAHRLIADRLLMPSSAAAQAMHMRPQLQEVQRNIQQSLQARASGSAGANPSILLFGEHGSGRQLVVERVVAALQRRNNTVEGNPAVGCVRLHGAVHGDERGAFREIARQLCDAFGLDFLRSASFEDNLRFLQKLMKDLSRAHKMVIFVLEDFDKFAHQTAKRQSVLYNILDFINTPGVQAALVGTTAMYSVIDSLEKRVLSRFSHRQVVLHTPPLRLRAEGASAAPGSTALAVLSDMLQLPSDGGATAAHDAYAARWNGSLRAALDDAATTEQLSAHLMTSPQSDANPTIAAGVLARLAMHVADQARCGTVRQWHLKEAIAALDPLQGTLVRQVAELSVLEAFMLAACHRICARSRSLVHDVNFAGVWEEFEKLQQLKPHPDHRPRPLAWRAFEALFDSRLLIWSNPRAARQSGLREFRPAQLQVPPQPLKRGITAHPTAPLFLRDWVENEAVVNTSLLLDDL